ncbi:MAG: glycosyltransferase family 4 protein [Bacteroidetes bacterium]|nr:glycosyltransferase family 4 protein [Bacteroidota bacterium]
MSRTENKSSEKKRILFFTPYSGRTGSEMMLYAVLRNLDKTLFDVQLISLRDGELASDKKNDFDIISLHETSLAARTENYIRRKITGITNLEKKVMEVHRTFRPHAWYLNTIVMPEVASIATKHKIPFVLHFHELQSQFNLIFDHDLEMQATKSLFNIGCAKVVCGVIEKLTGRKAELLYECVDLSSVKVKKETGKRFLSENNIPAGNKIVIMSGQRSEIKGFDIFIRVAEKLRAKKFHFLWLGASKNTGFNLYWEKIASGMKNVTLAHPSPSDYYSILDLADLFFLSSHSDPFPLVMTEAAFLGKPIIALDSGGASEFCTPGTGKIISSWNTDDIANEIGNYIGSQQDTSLSVSRAKEFEAALQAKKLEEILIRHLS